MVRGLARLKRAKKNPSFWLVAAGIALLITGALASVIIWRMHQADRTQATQLSNNASNDTGPSSEKPSSDDIASYKVAPNMPRYLIINKLNVYARVKPLGVDSSNTIAAPDNIYDAGWYQRSALPGKAGTMLMDGHVSSWTAKGIFYNLKNLNRGDQIQVERGDGILVSYRVVKAQVYDAQEVDMAAALSPVEPGKPGLNLITCSGELSDNNRSFKQRLVIFATEG